MKPNNKIKDEVVEFIFNWHEFPFDYWWRKRYNIPFGSSAHREMNFIDMYIEYQEFLLLNKPESVEEDYFNTNDDIVKMSEEEINDDYENLDLTKF